MSVQRSRSRRTDGPGPEGRPDRAVWLAIGLMAAVFVGAAAAILSWLGGAIASDAILKGGATFAGALILFVSMFEFMNKGRD